MEVVVGTYNEVLLGYKILKFDKEYQFEQTFTDNSHTGCVKCVNISSKGVLASGSTDETIHLFNLKKRTELGSLVHHSGTVTCLDFFKGQHMFSASEDGTICIWKFFTWECLKTLRGHKEAVNWVSVHPSGKLALSVGRDKKLRTWNLITGKCAYVTNIKQEADKVFWSPDGQHYVVLFSRKIDVYSTQYAEVTVSITPTDTIQALAYLSDNIIVYGDGGGHLYFYDIIKHEQLNSVNTETNRIKALCVVPPGEEDVGKDDTVLLLSASSDGFIKVYRIKIKNTVESELIASHNTKFRLTSMAVNRHCKANLKSESKIKVDNKIETRETEERQDDTDEDRASPDSDEAIQQSDQSSDELEDRESSEEDEEEDTPQIKSRQTKKGTGKQQSTKHKQKSKKNSSKKQTEQSEKGLKKKRKLLHTKSSDRHSKAKIRKT